MKWFVAQYVLDENENEAREVLEFSTRQEMLDFVTAAKDSPNHEIICVWTEAV